MAGGDAWLVALVFAAAICVLAAPVFGRAGWPAAADAAMVLAGVFGVAAFALAARDTLRAARRHAPPSQDPSSKPERREEP